MFRLQTRHGTVGVFATGHGPRFTVHATDGAVLAQDLDQAALAARFPELAEAYGMSYAGLDARVYHGEPKRVDGRLDAF
jgi:hypothetical protein